MNGGLYSRRFFYARSDASLLP